MKIITVLAVLCLISVALCTKKYSSQSKSKSKQDALFYDDSLYYSQIDVLKGTVKSISFFANIQPQDTYYFFQDDRTEDTKDDLGIVGTTILCNDDNQNCFLPYYFIKECKIEPKEGGGLEIETPEPKLEEILGDIPDVKFHFNLLTPEERRNSHEIAKKLTEGCKNAFKIYNERVRDILKLYEEIVKVKTELVAKQQELDALMRIAVYQFKVAKVNLLKLSLKKTLKMKLDEIEVQEKDQIDMAMSLADWLYINNDWKVYREALGFKDEGEEGNEGNQEEGQGNNSNGNPGEEETGNHERKRRK